MRFGIHELLDQIGAVFGPVILALSLAGSGEYRDGFLLLFIPFIVLLVLAFAAWQLLPDPDGFETQQSTPTKEGEGISREFVIFSLHPALYCWIPFIPPDICVIASIESQNLSAIQNSKIVNIAKKNIIVTNLVLIWRDTIILFEDV
ncbi:MAG: hypothetical protein V1862_02160 [Methanobacteriota archaeon]